MNIQYSSGYSDGLLDIINWLRDHEHLFCKKDRKKLKVVLNRIWKERNQFIHEKSNYEIVFTEAEQNLMGGI